MYMSNMVNELYCLQNMLKCPLRLLTYEWQGNGQRQAFMYSLMKSSLPVISFPCKSVLLQNFALPLNCWIRNREKILFKNKRDAHRSSSVSFLSPLSFTSTDSFLALKSWQAWGPFLAILSRKTRTTSNTWTAREPSNAHVSLQSWWTWSTINAWTSR